MQHERASAEPAGCDRFRTSRAVDVPDLHDRRLSDRRALQPPAAKPQFPERILPGQPRAGRLGLRADTGSHQFLGRQLHGLPEQDLHPRLEPGTVDRQLHGGPDLRDGAAGQTDQRGGSHRPGHHDSRRTPRPLPQYHLRPDLGLADRLLHDFQPDRPVQGRQHDPEDAAGSDRCLHLFGSQPARLDRFAVLAGQRIPAVPGGLRRRGDRLYDLRRFPRGGLDRRHAGRGDGHRRDNHAAAGNQPGRCRRQNRQGGRTGTGHPGHGQNGPSTQGNRDHHSGPGRCRCHRSFGVVDLRRRRRLAAAVQDQEPI